MWPLEEAPVNVLLALSTERMEAANMAGASVAASFADQHPEEEEDFALKRCFFGLRRPPRRRSRGRP
eukprot:2198664-Alexandrium_andersonii.AAC.1